jgi:protein-S-isoprenylcysteine O-methyltransferase Ste14
MWLTVRSILWTLVIPGVVILYIPWAFFGLGAVPISDSHPLQLVGLLLTSVGAAFLLVCIWEFVAYGRGTLSPVDPPKSLVVRGLYKYVRNPMYLSVLVVLLGEGLMTHSLGLFEYTLGWFVWINLVVLFYEEPALYRTFGDSYHAYTGSVSRWLPRPTRS